MHSIFSNRNEFIVTIEVVPPSGDDPEKLLSKLTQCSSLPFHAFSVASNPVAKPKMSALAFSYLLKKATNKPTILHLTTRDKNRLGLQSEIWGAKALGINTFIAVTGDPSALKSKHSAVTVGDIDVFQLIAIVENSGLEAGAVLDFRPEINGLDHEIKRLAKKVAAGSSFVVTQPVYDEKTAYAIHKATKNIKVPVIMGVLPLLSYRHSMFLHQKVAGIAIPDPVMSQIKKSDEPIQEGIRQSKKMLELAKSLFSGACLMPPFERFDILTEILQ